MPELTNTILMDCRLAWAEAFDDGSDMGTTSRFVQYIIEWLGQYGTVKLKPSGGDEWLVEVGGFVVSAGGTLPHALAGAVHGVKASIGVRRGRTQISESPS